MWADLDDFHADRLAFRGEGAAVAGNERHVTGARASGGEGVGIHRHVVIGDPGQFGRADRSWTRPGGTSRLGGVLVEHLHGCSEPVDGLPPKIHSQIVIEAKRLHRLGIALAEDVQDHIFVAQGVHPRTRP